MFLVKDLLHTQYDVERIYDTKDVLDIIIGITGNDQLADVDHVLSQMSFGDVFTRHP